ncbi:hypothetical protein RND81_13G027400 [Saponaria officinalis]|uniref:Uncharacterized protein n=1 Tax=Saponaria officinalis TaxID=3572 RepID=A0AAW1GTK8_SAPOF
MQPTNLNVFFGSTYISHPQSPYSNHAHKYHSIFTFMSTIIINLLQLKYQGSQFPSPFETNPTTISVALICFFLYCFFYHNPRFMSRVRVYNYGLNRGMTMVCGSLALACLGSLLFPLSAQTTALHVLYGAIGLVSVLCNAWLCWRRLYRDSSPPRRVNLLPVHTREIRVRPSNQLNGTFGI